jgi:mRNA-degrading endonuclease toxin of MazEF toxin-antitoxin module
MAAGKLSANGFDPTVGREIQKPSPTLVVRNNTSNRLAKPPSLPRSVHCSEPLDQALAAQTLQQIDEALKISLDLL